VGIMVLFSIENDFTDNQFKILIPLSQITFSALAGMPSIGHVSLVRVLRKFA
jgi:hypothetical protein